MVPEAVARRLDLQLQVLRVDWNSLHLKMLLWKKEPLVLEAPDVGVLEQARHLGPNGAPHGARVLGDRAQARLLAHVRLDHLVQLR
eukprot:12386584-Alexandrium_andersonii.AAC.1